MLQVSLYERTKTALSLTVAAAVVALFLSAAYWIVVESDEREYRLQLEIRDELHAPEELSALRTELLSLQQRNDHLLQWLAGLHGVCILVALTSPFSLQMGQMVPPRLRHIPGIALLIVAASIQPVIMVNETRAGQLVNRRYWEVSSFDSIERNRAEQRRDEAIFNLRKHKREIASGTAPMDLKALQQKRQDLYQARVRHDKELAKIENERTRRVLAASFANQSDTQPPTPMLVILASVMTISGWALLSRSSRGQKIS